MRNVMTSLVVRFRSTLAFFLRRDEVMNEFHPDEFPHWMRGENHFNLVDAKSRRVIRFEARRCIIRVEGQDSFESFTDCVSMALDILAKFEVTDIFGMRFESIQAKEARHVHQARADFSRKFLTNAALSLLPQDGSTDYGILLERTDQVDTDFIPAGAKIARRVLVNTTQVFLGPVSDKEVRDKWLEFKEESDNELYRTKPKVAKAAQIVGLRTSIIPKKNIKQASFSTLQKFYLWAIEQAQRNWDNTLGSE